MRESWMPTPAIVSHAELREELRRGKEAGAQPCQCREGYCICVTRESALRHAERAIKAMPRRTRDAAFWTGFAQARAQAEQ